MDQFRNVMELVNNPKNWKRTSKKSYEVYVCRPKPGTECTNRLEGAKYTTDQNKQFIISGTVGETWVIDVNKLAKTYTFMDGTPITPEALSSKANSNGIIDWMHLKTKQGGGATNWAIHLPLSVKNFPVQTSWGDELFANWDQVQHGIGDFLVCADNNGAPNLYDVWVVNGEIFPTTYDMRAFPGLISGDKLKAETPRPKSILGAEDKAAAPVTGQDKSGNKKVQYQIVGRYLSGKEVTGYHMMSMASNKAGRFTREQTAYLVGRGQVTNCSAQIYQDKVLYRGIGVSLDDLPVIQESGDASTLKNTDNIGKVRRGTSNADALTQVKVVGTIKSGRSTIGYVLQNAGGAVKKVSRDQVIELAKQNKIGNIRIQNYQGKVLIRGLGCNLDELPSETVPAPGTSQKASGGQTTDKLKQIIAKADAQLKDLGGFELHRVDIDHRSIELERQQSQLLKQIKDGIMSKLKEYNEGMKDNVKLFAMYAVPASDFNSDADPSDFIIPLGFAYKDWMATARINVSIVNNSIKLDIDDDHDLLENYVGYGKISDAVVIGKSAGVAVSNMLHGAEVYKESLNRLEKFKNKTEGNNNQGNKSQKETKVTDLNELYAKAKASLIDLGGFDFCAVDLLGSRRVEEERKNARILKEFRDGIKDGANEACSGVKVLGMYVAIEDGEYNIPISLVKGKYISSSVLIAKTIDQDDASAYYNVYRNNKMIDEKSSVEIKTGWSVELQDRNNTSHPYNVGKQIGREMGAYLKLADSRGVRYLM